jgi:hypothetical protein
MGRAAVLFCGALVALAFAAAAHPAGPIREPVVIEPFSFEAGDTCAFPVTVEAVRNKEIVKDFGDYAIITGRLFARVTNDTTHESIVVNISGQAKLVFGEDSVTQYARGGNLNFFFPGDLGPGAEGAILWTRGPIFLRFSPAGLEILRMAPRVTNLCEVLAGD